MTCNQADMLQCSIDVNQLESRPLLNSKPASTLLFDRQHDGDDHPTVFTPVNERSLVSAACIATEQIGQALGGVKAWGCRSMQPITVPNDLCRIDLDQKGPPLF
jgi:hypothetical protein